MAHNSQTFQLNFSEQFQLLPLAVLQQSQGHTGSWKCAGKSLQRQSKMASRPATPSGALRAVRRHSTLQAVRTPAPPSEVSLLSAVSLCK